MENWKKPRRHSLNPHNDPEWTDSTLNTTWEPTKIPSTDGSNKTGSKISQETDNIVKESEREEYVGTIHSAHNVHSIIGKECTADEVIKVWEEVSKFITLKMLEGFAVKVPGLGTFTYTIRKTPANQNMCVIKRAPQFFLSRYLVVTYGLREKNPDLVTTIPTVDLNLSVIAMDLNIPRGMVEGVMTEILQAFVRGIICGKAIELPVPYVGKLQIKDQLISFLFYEEFCKSLGFNIEEMIPEDSKQELDKVEEDMDPYLTGRMTPLELHIPTDKFRSVFHLREIRSVHDFPFLGETAKIQVPDFSLSSHAMITNVHDVKEQQKEKRYSYAIGKETEKMLVPTLMRQTYNLATQNFLLSWSNQDPMAMKYFLVENLYSNFLDTLGPKKIKSHFRRRGNKMPRRKFSYTRNLEKESKFYFPL